jgi:hypothetical protein
VYGTPGLGPDRHRPPQNVERRQWPQPYDSPSCAHALMMQQRENHNDQGDDQ